MRGDNEDVYHMVIMLCGNCVHKLIATRSFIMRSDNTHAHSSSIKQQQFDIRYEENTIITATISIDSMTIRMNDFWFLFFSYL